MIDYDSYGEGRELYILGAGDVEITEQRFLEDDLRSLIELHLLRHDVNSDGNNLYLYTRLAAQLIHSIDSTPNH